MNIKSIINIIFPCPPTIEEQRKKHLEQAKKALHLLELHHLDTIAAFEHYESAKTGLVNRINRLANN